MIVIEKNRVSILIGLTAFLSVHVETISLIGQRVVVTSNNAPTTAIIQYVSSLIFLIRIYGNNNIDSVMPKNTKEQIIMVTIIQMTIMDLLLSKTINIYKKKTRSAYMYTYKQQSIVFSYLKRLFLTIKRTIIKKMQKINNKKTLIKSRKNISK